jgi:hypothetical protein
MYDTIIGLRYIIQSYYILTKGGGKMKPRIKGGTNGIQTWVSDKDHKTITENCREYGVSLKEFVKELIVWSNGKTKAELIREGIRLPIWPEDQS